MSSENLDTRTKILAATWQLIEKEGAHGVRMSDIAKAVGISRQAIYLHFATRTELMIATTHYVDDVRGLKNRLTRYDAATDGIETLEAFVEFWGNYIPEIYALAKALLAVRATDEAAEAAWQDRMNAVRSGCRRAIEALNREGKLAQGWTKETAIDFCWTMLSVHNWEQLILDCRWTTEEYVSRMQALLKETFVK
jgi:AcrR family transcriptional regulator